MRPDRSIQTRRKAPKSTFTMLYAATRSTKRRKQRAATTATHEDLGEVPGVGIARALVVILLIHVAAIAGIYLHNKGSKNNDLKTSSLIVSDDEPPTLLDGYNQQFAVDGDNYPKMARRFGVSEAELKRLNENKPIKAGRKYNIPDQRNETTTPSQSIAGLVNPPEEITPPSPIGRPVIENPLDQSHPGDTPGALATVEGTPPPRVPTNDAVFIKPRIQPGQIEETPAAPVAPVASSSTHVVKSGETLWRIANNNGVSVDALMSLNGIKNAATLKIGTTLKIPTKR